MVTAKSFALASEGEVEYIPLSCIQEILFKSRNRLQLLLESPQHNKEKRMVSSFFKLPFSDLERQFGFEREDERNRLCRMLHTRIALLHGVRVGVDWNISEEEWSRLVGKETLGLALGDHIVSPKSKYRILAYIKQGSCNVEDQSMVSGSVLGVVEFCTGINPIAPTIVAEDNTELCLIDQTSILKPTPTLPAMELASKFLHALCYQMITTDIRV